MDLEKVLLEHNIDKCPECKCPVGEDWNYKDFTNKTVVICPQCNHHIYLEEQ